MEARLRCLAPIVIALLPTLAVLVGCESTKKLVRPAVSDAAGDPEPQAGEAGPLAEPAGASTTIADADESESLPPVIQLASAQTPVVTRSPEEPPEAAPIGVDVAAPVRDVVHADARTFEQEVLASEAPVLVDFYADWCGPCKRLTPVLEQLARDTPHAKVVKVNVDHSPKLASKYHVTSLPTLIVFKNGEAVAQQTGLADRAKLEQMLAR